MIIRRSYKKKKSVYWSNVNTIYFYGEHLPPSLRIRLDVVQTGTLIDGYLGGWRAQNFQLTRSIIILSEGLNFNVT